MLVENHVDIKAITLSNWQSFLQKFALLYRDITCKVYSLKNVSHHIFLDGSVVGEGECCNMATGPVYAIVSYLP